MITEDAIGITVFDLSKAATKGVAKFWDTYLNETSCNFSEYDLTFSEYRELNEVVPTRIKSSGFARYDI